MTHALRRALWRIIAVVCVFLCANIEAARSQPALPPLPAGVSLGPDEIRLDGYIRSINAVEPGAKDSSILIEATSFSLPGGQSRAIRPAKQKLVLLDEQTQVLQGKSGRPATLTTLKVGTSVTVCGQDLGSGQSLTARLVLLHEAKPITAKPAAAKPSGAKPAPRVETKPFRVTVGGRAYSGNLVRVHLDTVRMKVALGKGQVGLTESLAGMARRHNAIAAINGSFFQAYNRGPQKPPVMTLIINGAPVFTGNIGTTLGFTANNEARMQRASEVLPLLRGPSLPTDRGQSATAAGPFWPRVQEAVGCGPRLVTDGKVSVNMVQEKFTDPKVLRLSTSRSAVGLTSDRWLLLVTTQGTIPQLAQIMKALGASQAMNLDGGASSGLWLRGRYLRSPGRDLSNALLVLKP